MIGNLQVLRAIAALGVVIYHVDYHFADGIHTDLLGVATFFVLSGFIMCFITMDEAEGFLLKRATRIVPFYWLCVAFLLAEEYHHLLLRTSTWHELAPSVIRTLLFLPSDQPPVLGVGWTLNYEVYFYAIFAAALWINRRLAPLITCAVLLAVMAASHAAPETFLTRYYSNSYVRFFVFGIAVFYLWRTLRGRTPRLPTILLCSYAIITSYAVIATTLSLGWTLYYALPPIIVGAALLMASSGADITWRPLMLLGDASYALYLTHTILMDLIARFFSAGFVASAKSSLAPALSLIGLSVAVGLLTHLFVEKPTLRILRNQKWAIRPRSGVAPPRAAETHSHLPPNAAVEPD